jgi:hypothetical protein
MNIVKEKIFETLLQDIYYNDVVNKKVLKELTSDTGFLDYVKYDYASENNIDIIQYEDNPDEDFEDTEDFRKWFEYEIEYRFNNAKENLEELIDLNGEISIWRKMMVDENWIEHLEKKGQRLGIYWSWDMNAAEPHWGYNIANKNIEITIESVINENYVNWPPTILANMHPNYSEEKEIQLFKNTPLKIINIYKDGEKIEISKRIKNKTFKA